MLKLSLASSLGERYQIDEVRSDELKTKDWIRQTKLLIFPGGRDKPYHRKLSPSGNEAIRSFVEGGGSYLGICAGSYYAGEKVEFALESPAYRVSELRDLGFFPGVVRGPMYSGFSYARSGGVRAAKIVFEDPALISFGSFLKVYYNGGGYFVNAREKDRVRVIANYEGETKKAAIVEIDSGQGRAVLSAVHLEYNPYFERSNDRRVHLVNRELRRFDRGRKQLFDYLLSRLHIELPKSRDL